MNTFMAIMSQLFWGVTVGALSATFSALAQAAVLLGGLGVLGWYGLKRRERRRDGRDKNED
jgi:uncharacterized membrane protein